MRKVFMVVAVGAVLGALVAPAGAQVTIPVNITLGAGLAGTITAPAGGVTDECTDNRLVTITQNSLPFSTATSDTSGAYDSLINETAGNTYVASVPTTVAVNYSTETDTCAAASATYNS